MKTPERPSETSAEQPEAPGDALRKALEQFSPPDTTNEGGMFPHEIGRSFLGRPFPLAKLEGKDAPFAEEDQATFRQKLGLPPMQSPDTNQDDSPTRSDGIDILSAWDLYEHHRKLILGKHPDPLPGSIDISDVDTDTPPTPKK